MSSSDLEGAHWAAEGLRSSGDLPSLSRYDVRRRLGEGMSAVVYHAWDRELRRDVALKVLHESLLRSDLARERFRREVRSAAGIAHPNVIAVYDVGEAAGRLYCVMELVEGRHLGEMMKDPSLTRDDRLRLMEGVARGVAAAHAKGVVHRDLKPANILVSSTGDPKVGDFGLAHLMDQTQEVTRTGAILGTPAYMSPEQVRGKPGEISPATDVYSLGAILYEAVTGKAPHAAETVVELYECIAREEPVPPRRLDPAMSADLETVILKALRKEPSRRYPDAGALAEDLRKLRQGEPIEARPERWTRHAARAIRRHATAAAVAAIAIVAAVMVGAFALRSAQVRDAAVKTMRESARLSLDAALQLRRKGAARGELAPYLRTLEETYRKAVDHAPDVAELDYLLGRMHRALMNDEQALACQDRALQKDPGYAPGLYERVILRSRKYGSKIARVTEFVPRYGAEFAKENTPPRYVVDGALAARDRAEREDPEMKPLREAVLRDLAMLLAGGPGVKSTEVQAARGIQAFHLGEFAEAQRVLNECVAAEPLLEEAWETLAAAIEERCRGEAKTPQEVDRILREVEECAARALTYDRGYSPHWVRRANARFHAADAEAAFQAAEGDLREALRLDPNSWIAWQARGVLLANHNFGTRRQEDDLKQAESCFAEALRCRPNSAQSWLWRGQAWRYRAERPVGVDSLVALDEATRCTSEALRLNPGYWTAWRNRGRERSLRGSLRLERGQDARADFAAADEAFAHALGLMEHADLWMGRGAARLTLAKATDGAGDAGGALENYRLAIAHYDRAAQLDPALKPATEAVLRPARERMAALTPK